MRFLKNYTSIKHYLERFTVIEIGRLHIRIHRILSEDKTDFYHTHPFHYCSIILKGFYKETFFNGEKYIEKNNRVGTIIFRNSNAPHRITEAFSCMTLFFAWKVDKSFQLFTKEELNGESLNEKPECYQRNIKGKIVYCKCVNHKWFIGHEKLEDAMKEKRLSIYQVNQGDIIILRKIDVL